MIRLRHAKRASAVAALLLFASATLVAHDAERTRVSLTLDADGTFVLDVSNDANWLRLRLEDFVADYPALAPPPSASITDAERDARLRAFAPTFADRVVLWANHQEVRATSAEYVPPRLRSTDDLPIGTFRLRGRMPVEAQTFQWFYGIVIDPYTFSIRRPDGTTITETVLGNAWSRAIDVAGQFHELTPTEIARKYAAIGFRSVLPRNMPLLLLVVALTLATSRRSILTRGLAFTAVVAASTAIAGALPERSALSIGFTAAGVAAAEGLVVAVAWLLIAGHRDSSWYQRRVVNPAAFAAAGAAAYVLFG